MCLSWRTVNVNYKTEYSFEKNIIIYLVGYERCTITLSCWGNYNVWALSTTIDTFKWQNRTKTSHIDHGTRQMILLYDNALSHSTIPKNQSILWVKKFFIMQLILQIWPLQISISFVLYSISLIRTFKHPKRSKMHNQIA